MRLFHGTNSEFQEAQPPVLLLYREGSFTPKADKMTKKKIQRFLQNRIVDKLTESLIEEFHFDEITAMELVYNSKLYDQLQDTSNQLYIQSPDHLYESLRKEKEVLLSSTFS